MKKMSSLAKKIGCLSMILGFLSSCHTQNNRFNYIIAGIYEGTDQYNPAISSHITIEEIDEEIYLASRGINVIQDQINFKYYCLDFYLILNTGEKRAYTFTNLKDAYNKSIKVPIAYKDDNNLWFSPHLSVHGRTRELIDYSCSVTLTDSGDDLKIHTYMDPIDVN